MTPDRLRTAALALPDVEERADGFYVADAAFVRLASDGASVLASDGWAPLADDDALEDRVAAAWELAAPRALLEAGGR